MKPDYAVVIAGAGFAGLGMAMRLKASGERSFVVLEAGDAVGGTWRDNTYPGCACDIPAQLYSFSFAPSHDWTRLYPAQDEIAGYLRRCAGQAGLWPFIRLSAGLAEAVFDEGNGWWELHLSGGRRLTAGALVCGLGPLSAPALPDVPGLASFAGMAFHSARWDHGAALAGRRVAVIGTGASAAQFVPEIAPVAARLTVFQRTAPWVLPKGDRAVTPGERRRLLVLPGYRRALRARLYWSHEVRAMAFLHPRLMLLAERQARDYLARQVPEAALRARLQPGGRLGCRRVVLSDTYYPALTRPNVDVVTTPIAHATPGGLRLADGSDHAADVLIYATGFRPGAALAAVRIVGRGGRTLQDSWRDGAQAHLGVTVAGYPNLFLLAGPNTGLGHSSIVFMIEAQIRYVLSALALSRRRGAPLEVRAAVQRRSTADVQARLGRTVWATGCRSWYLGPAGHNATLWPGYSWQYWWRTRHVAPEDYEP